jgi:hypothetical protein
VLKNERKIIGLGKFGPGIGKIPKGDPNELILSRIFNFICDSLKKFRRLTNSLSPSLVRKR